jgi:hypothetical protein
MDGDALVCSPLGPSDYRSMCDFNQYGLGVICLVQGSSLIYNARRLGKIRAHVVSNAAPPNNNKAAPSKRQHASFVRRNVSNQKITHFVGCGVVCTALAHWIGGNGTVYASSTIPGLVADLVYAIRLSFILKHIRYQLQAAKEFQSLVKLDSAGTESFKYSRITYISDVMQGVGAVPFALGIWLLLVGGVIARAGFYFVVTIVLAVVGWRTVISNLILRGRTISRIEVLQQNANGTVQDKHRRRNLLKVKVRALIRDMLVIMAANVFVPLTLLMFKSMYSSTQWLVHQGIYEAIMCCMMTVMCMTTHKHVNKSISRAGIASPRRTKTGTSKLLSLKESNEGRKFDDNFTIANESGMSVVGESEVAFGSRQTTESSGVRLFSEVESSVKQSAEV